MCKNPTLSASHQEPYALLPRKCPSQQGRSRPSVFQAFGATSGMISVNRIQDFNKNLAKILEEQQAIAFNLPGGLDVHGGSFRFQVRSARR